MAAPNVKPRLFVRGILSFGGTQIGSTRGHVYKPQERSETIPAWEHGGIPIQKVYMGASPIFIAVLRSFDYDALQACFPSTESTAGRYRVVHKVGDDSVARAGSLLLSTKNGVLLWTPEKTTDQPAIKMYAAFAETQYTAELQLSPLIEFGIPVAFTAAPNTDGIQDRMGRLGDLA